MKTTPLILMSVFYFSSIYAYDFPIQPIKSYECDACFNLSRDTLEDKWAISNEPLGKKASNLRTSYSYVQRATLKQLQKGVVISTLAPGAIVRITPLHKKSMPQFILKTPTNKQMDLKEASTLYSQNEALGDTDFAIQHQTMLQLKPELGAGQFIIKSNTVDPQYSDTYLINVYDKYSLTYLQIKTDSTHYQYDDKLTATITLKDDEVDYSVDDIDVTLIGPEGQEEPVELTQVKHNKFEASAILDSEINDHGANWYIEADVQAVFKKYVIQRSGRTAFSYSIPSATLLSIKKLESKHLLLSASVDVATASRYSLQSVLFHKDSGGTIIPIETSQKTQWLTPGKHTIQFIFDNSSHLSEDSLYLGYLRLIDYGQLKPVYQYNHPVKLTQLVE
jgi:hypothetical protein